MKTLAGWLVALLLASGLILALLDVQDAKRENAELVASLRDAEQRESIALARYAEAVTDKETVTVRVIRYATRYDTIRASLPDSLYAETRRTGELPHIMALVEAADSAIAACRELVTSCERLKVAADSSIHALGAQRDALQKLWEKERPSKWDRAKPWVFGAAGLYVGLKLRVP